MFDALLQGRPAALFDGGLATELERRGAVLDDALWSARLLLDDPDAIVAVHEAYLRAGCDVITTASYQASREGFAQRGCSAREADGLIARAVELAREAQRRAGLAGQRALVAASLGPHGATLADGSEYRGDTLLSEEALTEFHRPRLDAAWEARPDFVLFETVPSLREVRALAALARSRPAVPVMVSCSAVDPRGISHGERFSEAARALDAAPSVFAVGVNCAPPEVVRALLREGARAAPRLLRGAMPNRGEVWNAATRRWEGDEGFDAARFAGAYLAQGARLVGGCCRTTPDDTAALRRALDAAAHEAL